MQYVLVNPFSSGTSSKAVSGIDVYTGNAAKVISNYVDLSFINNDRGFSREEFQRIVRDVILQKYQPDAVIIEAPESRASTLLLPSEFKTHIRLHCPSALAQYHNGVEIDYNALNEEIDVIKSASVVTAPSFIMKEEINALIKELDVLVFNNPLQDIRISIAKKKTVDVLFLNRFQKLKGVEFINQTLELLPSELFVILAGSGSEYFTLSKKIRCNVRILREIRGEKRFELISSSRCLIVPSYFESYSTTLSEGVLCGTTTVCWDSVGGGEVSGEPVVHSIKFGDVEELAKRIICICDGVIRYPTENEFNNLRIKIRDNYKDGVEAVLSKLMNINNSVEIPRYSVQIKQESKNEKYFPILGQIAFKGKDMSYINPVLGNSKLKRKLRKLFRDPKAFFRDAKSPFANRKIMSHIKSTSVMKSADPEYRKHEPRVIGEITFANTGLNIVKYDKKVAQSDMSTVYFTKKSDDYLIHLPIIGDVLRENDFVGFKNRYLFVMYYDLGGRYKLPNEMESLFDSSEKWGAQLFSEIRNVIFYNPCDLMPFMVKATNLNVRLIVILTNECNNISLVKQMSSEIDVLVFDEPSYDSSGFHPKRKIYSEQYEDVTCVIRKIIVDNMSKEKNMLVPAYGISRYLSDIDSLNESNYDGVILLKDKENLSKVDDFELIIGNLSECIESILLREEKCIQYMDYCDLNNPCDLLKITLKDGCRYEVRA